MPQPKKPVEVLILAVPQTAGSALYGMIDVLMAAGNLWQALTGTEDARQLFNVRIVSTGKRMFRCGNDIPVQPHCSIDEDPDSDILILPELWLGPDEDISGRYTKLMQWIREKYKQGTYLYSACSGAILLAESGLLDGCPATSHWGYRDMFRKHYPKIRFNPEPNLVFANQTGRIVTAGGTTSWHDLAIHIIARHASTGEALRIAKVYLLKWHDEGQLPYAPLDISAPHADSVARSCEQWLKTNFRKQNVIKQVVEHANIAERTLKRRFKAATGATLIEYLQNLRIEEAKRLLENEQLAIDDISINVGYEDHSFFRRLFKRLTGLTPSQYRKLFQSSEFSRSMLISR